MYGSQPRGSILAGYSPSTFSAASSGFGLSLALVVLCRWVNDWRTDGSKIENWRTYGIQPRDIILRVFSRCFLRPPLASDCHCHWHWGVFCGWMNGWRAGGRISIAKRRIYGTQLIDSILVGRSLMSPCVFLRLMVIIGIEVAVWANGSRFMNG